MFFQIVKILVITACCTAAGTYTMHRLQAEKYQISALWGRMRRNESLIKPEIIIALLMALVNWYLPILLSMAITREAYREALCGWIMLAVFVGISAIMYMQKRNLPMKKPFAITRRICRLIAVTLALNLIGCLILSLVSLSPYLMYALNEYIVLIAALIMNPVEERINAKFYKTARQKLAAAKQLTRIGITGSYGKTHTKMILKTILSEKYSVLATPPGFSTAMGISRTVCDQLSDAHQIFIAEMGAQHRGEIREMAKLVRPQYGILTCVGKAHLDTFGSLENVAQTKFELIQSLPENGKAFFGSDGSYGDRLYGLCRKEKYRAGIGTEVECYMHAEHIECGVHGTRFELICSDGGHAWMHTRLLGSCNVQNIAIAASVARQLGMTMEEIVRGVEKIRPLRHQMQLTAGEINVIDDSASVLPEAAAEALRVLADFPGRRILVTGGFTELDKDASDKNYAFGTQIPGCADYVILIDPEFTRPIVRGMVQNDFPKSSLRIVSEEGDAAAIVKEIAQKGDTVLYEGILPEEDAE